MEKKENTKKTKREGKAPFPISMSADELQHIIAKALVEAEEIKEAKQKKQREYETETWRNTIGYKEFSDKNRLIRGIKHF